VLNWLRRRVRRLDRRWIVDPDERDRHDAVARERLLAPNPPRPGDPQDEAEPPTDDAQAPSNRD
jgi:hypothetical protein